MELIMMILFLIMVIGVTISTIWFLLVDDKSDYNFIYVCLLGLFIAQYMIAGAFIRHFGTHGYSETLDTISGDIVFWTIGGIVFPIVTISVAFLIYAVRSDDKPVEDGMKEQVIKVKQKRAKTKKAKVQKRNTTNKNSNSRK